MTGKSSDNEPLLVRRLSGGDIEAFNILFREYSSRLYRFAYGYLKSVDDTKELVQEVFTKIWERRSDLDENMSFKCYIFTISFNIIKKHFRSKAIQYRYLLNECRTDFDISTSEKIICDSTNNYISDLVKKFPCRRREIYIRSRVEGQSISDIAEAMSISHKTVENQLSTALSAIREGLIRENSNH